MSKTSLLRTLPMASGTSEPKNAKRDPAFFLVTDQGQRCEVHLDARLEHHEHQAKLAHHHQRVGFGRDVEAVGSHRDAREDLADQLVGLGEREFVSSSWFVGSRRGRRARSGESSRGRGRRCSPP